MRASQQVTFLTDGGNDVRELPLYPNLQAEHLIDCFHSAPRGAESPSGMRDPPTTAAAAV